MQCWQNRELRWDSFSNFWQNETFPFIWGDLLMPDVFPCRNLGFPWRRSWGKFQNLVMLQRFPAAVGCGCSGGCVRSLEYFGPAKVACRCEILALDQMQHTMEIIPVWKITELQFHSFYSLLLFCFFSFFSVGFLLLIHSAWPWPAFSYGSLPLHGVTMPLSHLLQRNIPREQQTSTFWELFCRENHCLSLFICWICLFPFT